MAALSFAAVAAIESAGEIIREKKRQREREREHNR
jgi:hypothetical protein